MIVPDIKFQLDSKLKDI